MALTAAALAAGCGDASPPDGEVPRDMASPEPPRPPPGGCNDNYPCGKDQACLNGRCACTSDSACDEGQHCEVKSGICRCPTNPWKVCASPRCNFVVPCGRGFCPAHSFCTADEKCQCNDGWSLYRCDGTPCGFSGCGGGSWSCIEPGACGDEVCPDKRCCGDKCVDTRSDVGHCGGCGNSCPKGNTCCEFLCADTAKDVNNCGGCGKKCLPGQYCKGDCRPVHAWSLNGVGGESSAESLEADGDGNVYVTGNFHGTKDFGGGPLVAKQGRWAFLASYGKDGKHRWSKAFGDPDKIGLANFSSGRGVALDAAGNVYLTGQIDTTVTFGGASLVTAGRADVFVASFTKDGQHRWSKRFGSKSYDRGHAVSAEAGGNIYVTGILGGETDFGGGAVNSNAFLASFKTDGSYRWAIGLGSSFRTAGHPGGPPRVAVDGAGNVFVADFFEHKIDLGGGALAGAGAHNGFVASFSGAGKYRWAKALGGTDYSSAESLTVDKMGNVYVTGGFGKGAASIDGIWLNGVGWTNAFVASFSGDGKVHWAKDLGAGEITRSRAITADALGNLFVTGVIHGAVDFGGGAIKGPSMFIVSYFASGKYRWSRGFGDYSSDPESSSIAEAGGAVSLAGSFEGSLDFGGGDLMAGAKYRDLFIVQLRE